MQQQAATACYGLGQTTTCFSVLRVSRRDMSLRQEAFQSIAIDDQLATVARNQMLALECDQVFGDSRPRSANQFSEIPMTGRQRQPDSLWIRDAEIFT